MECTDEVTRTLQRVPPAGVCVELVPAAHHARGDAPLGMELENCSSGSLVVSLISVENILNRIMIRSNVSSLGERK